MTVGRVLLFGGSGQLGADIRRTWADYTIVAPTRSDADIENVPAIVALLDAERPDLVINCAAFHHVERCEEQPERAFAVNALAVNRLAELCCARDLRFVTFSTDYVFSGNQSKPYVESDAPGPVNTYGVSKCAGEMLVLRLAMKAYVIRVCGLYGLRVSSSKGYTFVDRVIDQARKNERLRVVSDQTVSPTYTGHVAGALRRLVRTPVYGLYHMVNEGNVTWHEFATEVLQQAGLKVPVDAIDSSAFASTARRPRYSALQNARLAIAGIAMPTWRDGISAYLQDRVK